MSTARTRPGSAATAIFSPLVQVLKASAARRERSEGQLRSLHLAEEASAAAEAEARSAERAARTELQELRGTFLFLSDMERFWQRPMQDMQTTNDPIAHRAFWILHGLM